MKLILLDRCRLSTAVSRSPVEELKYSLITRCCPSARDMPGVTKMSYRIGAGQNNKFLQGNNITYDVFISSSIL